MGYGRWRMEYKRLKNKIKANHWMIMCFIQHRDKPTYSAKIDYTLSDESHTKSHSFDTFEEAYQWIKDQVIMA